MKTVMAMLASEVAVVALAAFATYLFVHDHPVAGSFMLCASIGNITTYRRSTPAKE